jgi:hypothetical protein
MSILDQADNPRRLVTHDDDSDVSSCAYPYATVLDGIRWWVQRDRLSFPLHGVEDQSRPWGPCVTPASGGEELHLYGTQVIKDLVVSTPHPWHLCHFEGTDRSFPVCTALPSPSTMSGSDALTVLNLPFGGAYLGLAPQEPSGPPTFLTPLSTHTMLLVDPDRPSGSSPKRFLCIGF